jgi:hypothetical protein
MSYIIERPVFVLGCPRSGTTIFERVLAFHPDFSWPSGYTNRFPSLPQLSMLSRIHDLALIGRYSRIWHMSKIIPSPNEPFTLFSRIDGNFDFVDRTDPRVPQVTSLDNLGAETIDEIRRIVRIHQIWQGKDRFITKVTDNCLFARI